MNFGPGILSMNSRRFPIAVAIAAAAICLLIELVSFPYQAFEPDTAAYLFQARLFAEGVLAAPAPPDFGLSPSPHKYL